MLNYLNDDIKKDYIEWVKFIYDDNYNDSVITNERLFVAFVEDKINTDLYNYFKDNRNKILICNDCKDLTQLYYCAYFLNNERERFNNGTYYYYISTTKLLDKIYYGIVDLIQDIPF